MDSQVNTRFLILSDTHGEQPSHPPAEIEKFDVAIHCGDLTEQSKLQEFRATHGPPRGILDYTSRVRAGSPSLFTAIARARPRLHCFGHIHGAWGAKFVTWRDTEQPSDSETLNHFVAINNEESTVIESLTSIRPHKFDTAEMSEEKRLRRIQFNNTGYCRATMLPKSGLQTLFVNAAIEGPADDLQQWPWIADIALPKSSKKMRRISNGSYTAAERPSKKTKVETTT